MKRDSDMFETKGLSPAQEDSWWRVFDPVSRLLFDIRKETKIWMKRDLCIWDQHMWKETQTCMKLTCMKLKDCRPPKEILGGGFSTPYPIFCLIYENRLKYTCKEAWMCTNLKNFRHGRCRFSADLLFLWLCGNLFDYRALHVWQCIAACCNALQCVALCCSDKGDTRWRRLIGCLKLQVIDRKRATNYRALLQKMTYKDKASYGSLPPCICLITAPWYFAERCSVV